MKLMDPKEILKEELECMESIEDIRAVALMLLGATHSRDALHVLEAISPSWKEEIERLNDWVSDREEDLGWR